jgi:hypothetical protein
MCNICIELQFVQSNYNVFGNLFLKENKRKFLSQETYMSLEQSINLEYICPSRSLKKQAQIKNVKNLHVYYEKDHLCYLAESSGYLLNNI